MADGTEKELFAFPEKIKELDGREIGDFPISAEQILSKDDRSAVLVAAAEHVEQKKRFSSDLSVLLKEFNITHKEIVLATLSRQIKRMLSK